MRDRLVTSSGIRVHAHRRALACVVAFAAWSAACDPGAAPPARQPPGAAKLIAVAVSPRAPTIDKADTVQLTATGSYDDGSSKLLSSLSWMSSDSGVATVSDSGRVTGVDAGTAVITASDTATGLSGNTTVTVREEVEPPPPAVGWCRLHWPVTTTAGVGEEVVVYGRVYVEGLTDLTDGVDTDTALVAEVGFGPEISWPIDNDEWTWVAAGPNPDWNAAAASPPEPNNDEYQAALSGFPLGIHDLAYRFSLDAGEHWTYCDANAGEGSDGSQDGYQVEHAGRLQVIAVSCDPNPCTNPPAATCDADGVTRRSSPVPGTCTPASGQVSCDYEVVTEDCSTHDEVCRGGACITPAVDWCRLQWPIEATVILGTDVKVFGRVFVSGLTDASDSVDTSPALKAQLGYGADGTLPSEDASWDAHWIDAGPNPDWSAAAASEPNHDEYEATLTGVPLGTYDFAYRFSLDGGTTWTYCDKNAGSGADGSADDYQPANAGTLVVHDACDPAPADTTVDWCRLQWPLTATAAVGEEVLVYGRVYEAGVTDRSTLVDAEPQLVAQVGYGADGSDPGVDVWIWVDAGGNPAWDGGAEGKPNDDEYMGAFTVPAEGDYDFAYRFSRDCGATWLYCDAGASGSDGGYQVADAGQLTVTPP